MWSYKTGNGWIEFGMGLLACVAVFMLIVGCEENKALSWIAKYTIPIFLMHTLFAAPVRAVLMKAGIRNSLIHVVIGIAVSFFAPIVAMIILEKIKLDCLVYPSRYSKRRGK